MKTFLVILAIVLWVTFKSFSKYAAKTKAEGDAEGYSSSSAKDVPEGTFESLFAEDPFASSDDDPYEAAEQDYSEQAAVEHAFSNQRSQYFSYEHAPQGGSAVASPKARTKKASVQSKEDSSNVAADFDLRQAVIYQTILTNKYLDEVSSYEN